MSTAAERASRPHLRLVAGAEEVIQGSTEWEAARRKGVGGSDIPALLGLDRYKTVRELWELKTGRIDRPEQNESMTWGHLTEPLVADEFERRTGIPVRIVDGLVRHPKYEWAVASLDRRAGDDAVLEIKNSRYGTGYGEPMTDQVPLKVAAQVAWYLGITGLPIGYVAVLIGGQEQRHYRLGPDPDLFAKLLQIAADFWRHVVTDEPPPLEPHPTTLDLLARMHPEDDGREIEAPPDLYDVLDELRIARGDVARAKERADELEATVKDFMGSASKLVHPGGSITWKRTNGREKLDLEGLLAELKPDPALIRKHTKQQGGYRVFRSSWRSNR